MIYNDGSTSTLYYYVLNAQGDVIALLNANGKLAASYDYDAWGNCTVYDAATRRLATSTPCATAAITTTPRPASTTSRAAIMTRPSAGSSTPTGYLQMGLLGQICLHTV